MNSPLVVIKWRDAEDYRSGWTAMEHINAWCAKECIIVSIGWVVKRTKNYIVLCADYAPSDGAVARVTRIPKKMVVKQYTIKEER